jgi:hypothetical protein
MNGQAKYIVVEKDYELIYIFPSLVQHADTFRDVGGKIISAGFINERWECFGKSVSLQVGSREEKDTALAKKLFAYY